MYGVFVLRAREENNISMANITFNNLVHYGVDYFELFRKMYGHCWNACYDYDNLADAIRRGRLAIPSTIVCSDYSVHVFKIISK